MAPRAADRRVPARRRPHAARTVPSRHGVEADLMRGVLRRVLVSALLVVVAISAARLLPVLALHGG